MASFASFSRLRTVIALSVAALLIALIAHEFSVFKAQNMEDPVEIMTYQECYRCDVTGTCTQIGTTVLDLSECNPSNDDYPSGQACMDAGCEMEMTPTFQECYRCDTTGTCTQIGTTVLDLSECITANGDFPSAQSCIDAGCEMEVISYCGDFITNGDEKCDGEEWCASDCTCWYGQNGDGSCKRCDQGLTECSSLDGTAYTCCTPPRDTCHTGYNGVTNQQSVSCQYACNTNDECTDGSFDYPRKNCFEAYCDFDNGICATNLICGTSKDPGNDSGHNRYCGIPDGESDYRCMDCTDTEANCSSGTGDPTDPPPPAGGGNGGIGDLATIDGSSGGTGDSGAGGDTGDPERKCSYGSKCFNGQCTYLAHCTNQGEPTPLEFECNSQSCGEGGSSSAGSSSSQKEYMCCGGCIEIGTPFDGICASPAMNLESCEQSCGGNETHSICVDNECTEVDGPGETDCSACDGSSSVSSSAKSSSSSSTAQVQSPSSSSDSSSSSSSSSSQSSSSSSESFSSALSGISSVSSTVSLDLSSVSSSEDIVTSTSSSESTTESSSSSSAVSIDFESSSSLHSEISSSFSVQVAISTEGSSSSTVPVATSSSSVFVATISEASSQTQTTGDTDDDGDGDNDDGQLGNQDDDDDGDGDNDDGITGNQTDDDNGDGDNDDGIAGNNRSSSSRATFSQPRLVAAAGICGNGVLETSEECDDSNRRNDDGCSAECLLEIGICGDGVVQKLLGEQCEQLTFDTSLPYSCVGCRFVTTTCGNGVVDPGEECDDGAANSDDSDANCRATCTFGRCGDGVLDSSELCDDGNRLNGDGCDRYCLREHSQVAAEATSSAQTILFGQSNTSTNIPFGTFQQMQFPYTANQLPLAQLQPLIQGTAPVGDTGPAAVAVIGAGAAAGFSWIRRKRK